MAETEIKPTANFNAWRIAKHTPEEFAALDGQQRLSYLIECGTLAPSTHNTQPWFFEADSQEGTVTVNLDKSRVLPVSDRVGRQACISVGAAIANISTAASFFGYKTDVHYEDVSVNDIRTSITQNLVPLAKIDLSQTNPEPATDTKLFEAIFTRAINRNLYDKTRQIPQGIVDIIKSTEQSTIRAHILQRTKLLDRPRIQVIAELQGQADSVVVNDSKFTRELADWLLPNDTTLELGMPGDTFGLKDELSKKFHRGLKGEVIIEAAEKAALIRSGRDGLESASLIALITADSDTPSEWVKAGVVFGNIALRLEAQDVSVAVHAALAEVALVRRGLSLAFGKISSHPMLLFRAGYTDRKNPHSPRLSLNQVSAIT